jgi:sugar (pentulose or hexulose) kinase
LEYNFGNEGGAFNTITFLKNIANLWFVQEFRRIWSLRGEEYSWDQLAQMAGSAAPFQAFIDPDDPEFMLPGDMPTKIQRKCLETGQPVPQTKGEILRVVYESLAFKYRFINDHLSNLTGQEIETMHIVGGGSQNQLLDQFSASAMGLPVIAGPTEATTLGNLIVQMISLGLLASMEEGRELVRRSFPTRTFWPEEIEKWDEAYRVFLARTRLQDTRS